MKLTIILFFAITLTGCASFKTRIIAPLKTQGDPLNSPSYGYTPLDPVSADIDSSLLKLKESVANVLTDETMRLAIGNVSGSGNITYGKSLIGVKGQRYIVVLDYIKYVTIPFPVTFDRDSSELHIVSFSAYNATDNKDTKDNGSEKSIIPLYVGVGLRITADITINTDSLSLDLFGLGAAASLHKASGTLVIQLLGVSNEKISDLIPFPSKLDESTVENAIVALATIRSKMYDKDTRLYPQVVGYYNNIGGLGMEVTNNVISTILTKPIIVKKLTVQDSGDNPKKGQSGKN